MFRVHPDSLSSYLFYSSVNHRVGRGYDERGLYSQTDVRLNRYLSLSPLQYLFYLKHWSFQSWPELSDIKCWSFNINSSAPLSDSSIKSKVTSKQSTKIVRFCFKSQFKVLTICSRLSRPKLQRPIVFAHFCIHWILPLGVHY